MPLQAQDLVVAIANTSMQALDPARDTRLLWETRLVVAIAKEARVP